MNHQWIITYNTIDNGCSLMYGYETIEGKNAKDALNKRFNKNFERLTGDAGRYAQIILVKGYNVGNVFHYSGRYSMLCYSPI